MLNKHSRHSILFTFKNLFLNGLSLTKIFFFDFTGSKLSYPSVLTCSSPDGPKPWTISITNRFITNSPSWGEIITSLGPMPFLHYAFTICIFQLLKFVLKPLCLSTANQSCSLHLHVSLQMIVAFNIIGSFSLFNADPLPTFGFLNYADSFYHLVISCIIIPLAVNFVFVILWMFYIML